MLVVLSLAASPVAAQLLSSPGEKFLIALRAVKSNEAAELVESNPTVVNYRGQDGVAALHLMTRSRNSNWLGFLLQNGADPNIADKNGETSLIIAARGGYGEGVARMLMSGALVDKPNRLGETALIVAVQQRQASIVSSLLKLGADPDRADYAAGYTARDYAKRDSRSREMLRLIETVKSQKARIAPAKPAK